MSSSIVVTADCISIVVTAKYWSSNVVPTNNCSSIATINWAVPPDCSSMDVSCNNVTYVCSSIVVTTDDCSTTVETADCIRIFSNH